MADMSNEAAEPEFSIGDRVEFIEQYGSVEAGATGTVYETSSGSSWTIIRVELDDLPARGGKRRGVYPSRLKNLTTEARIAALEAERAELRRQIDLDQTRTDRAFAIAKAVTDAQYEDCPAYTVTKVKVREDGSVKVWFDGPTKFIVSREFSRPPEVGDSIQCMVLWTPQEKPEVQLSRSLTTVWPTRRALLQDGQ